VERLQRFAGSKRAPLILLAVFSLAGYAILSIWFPLRPNYALDPSPDIRSLAPSFGEGLAYAVLLLLLYGLYWLAFRHVRRRRVAMPLLAILLTTALFCLPLLFTFPINATDAYRYFLFGRISGIHGQNPFSVTVAAVDNEPFSSLAGEWAAETSPYGPVWEAVAAGTAKLVRDDLLGGLLMFKALAALTHLASTVVIWLSLRETEPAERSAHSLLWAWNPALLLIFAVDAHNDGLMLLWLLLGWWTMALGRPQVGMILMLLAPLTKPIGLLPLPYFFLASWRRQSDSTARLRFLLITAVSAAILAWLAFLPFGDPLALAERLLSESGTGGGFSPLALFILGLQSAGAIPPYRILIRGTTLLFSLFALLLLWLTWRGRSPLRAAADIFGGFILQSFRFRIWYAAWLFPWLILDHGLSPDMRSVAWARLAAGLTFLLTSQLSVVVYGQLRTESLAGSQLLAHFLGVFMTFAVPLLVGLGVAAYNARSRSLQAEK
jgi:alpha-1,6-mannosyltransferase